MLWILPLTCWNVILRILCKETGWTYWSMSGHVKRTKLPQVSARYNCEICESSHFPPSSLNSPVAESSLWMSSSETNRRTSYQIHSISEKVSQYCFKTLNCKGFTLQYSTKMGILWVLSSFWASEVNILKTVWIFIPHHRSCVVS